MKGHEGGGGGGGGGEEEEEEEEEVLQLLHNRQCKISRHERNVDLPQGI